MRLMGRSQRSQRSGEGQLTAQWRLTAPCG
jgi:hypothetical protein